MGILVRLVTSMVGALMGIVPALALALATVGVLAEAILQSLGDPNFSGSPLATPLLGAVFLLGGLIAIVGGYIGAVRGYRGGLALGREICATNGPEQHSRIGVNHNHTRVS
jgi:hypothetical protein